MFKSLKMLALAFGLLLPAVGGASAATLVEEQFTFSYSSTSPFTLSSLSYASATSGNLLTTLSPFTTFQGGSLNGTGSLTQNILVDPAQTYFANYSVSGQSSTVTTGFTVAPVPLPASFPLFALALVCLGLYGYKSSHSNRWFSNQAQQAA